MLIWFFSCFVLQFSSNLHYKILQYNELLPYNMVPSGGGFYINRGKLDLVQASDASTFEDDSTEIPSNEKSRKRKLLDSDSDEDKFDNNVKKHKKKVFYHRNLQLLVNFIQ